MAIGLAATALAVLVSPALAEPNPFTDQQPETFWHVLQPSEYGFWANVNPAVPHPRWSQATERLLGSGELVPTQAWNGYGEWVAAMYADKQNKRLFT